MFYNMNKEHRKLSVFSVKEKEKQFDNMNFSNIVVNKIDNRHGDNIMVNKHTKP